MYLERVQIKLFSTSDTMIENHGESDFEIGGEFDVVDDLDDKEELDFEGSQASSSSSHYGTESAESTEEDHRKKNELP